MQCQKHTVDISIELYLLDTDTKHTITYTYQTYCYLIITINNVIYCLCSI
jgi:hypothetical protein